MVPDFHAIARQLCEEAPGSLQANVAEQLRQVWNARGAADERALKAEVQRALDALIVQARIEIHLEPLIKALDR